MATTTPPTLLRRIGVKLTKWVLITIALGSLPLIIKMVFLLADGTLTAKALVGTGELFLISAGISASGIGELYFRWRESKSAPRNTPPRSNATEGVAVVASLFVVAIGAALYGRYETGPSATATALTGRQMWISLILFIAALIASAACVVISELERRL